MARWVSAVLAVLAIALIVSLGFTELAAASGRATGSTSYMLLFVSLVALIMLVIIDQRPHI